MKCHILLTIPCRISRVFTATLFSVLLARHANGSQPLEICFNKPPQCQLDAAGFPSSGWESQAQPLGNGRLGAMVFGNHRKERIQFNEISLWTGGANPSGGYDIDGFGAYQNFGDLFIDMSGGDAMPAVPVCASGQASASGEDVSAASDGRADTKWCMEHQGREIIWQIDLGKAREVGAYSFTSGSDVPERDPRVWRFEGSADARSWTRLDERSEDKPFEKRGETKTFTAAKKGEFRHYRFVFSPNPGIAHFQVADITPAGITTGSNSAPSFENFSRNLNLDTATHLTTWKLDGVTYTREVFVSKPDEVLLIRISADQPGKASGTLRLAGGHGETTTAAAHEMQFSGSLGNGLRYAAGVGVVSDGGKVVSSGDQLTFSGNSVTIILAAATDYALDPKRNFRSGIDPELTVTRQVAAAAAKTHESMRRAHVADFQQLMGRVRLDLGPPPAGKSTPERIEAYKSGAEDPHLESLMFQYGRYLLISSSRGFLPANLQGLWNDSNKPAWYSDYHTNINLQMNYWLAEPANLSECALPLLNWTMAMVPGSREATVREFGEKTPGWTMRTSVNIFGGNGWDWNHPASAWLAQHFMEHFRFTGDTTFLKDSAWPVLRDVSEFWLGHLIEKNGKLLVPDGWSPEHGPREDGVAHDQQIIWDLFSNTIEAAAALGIKNSFVAKVASAREKLLGPEIGSWGQIMEWTTERPELEKSGHRHTSHLFAVYPGNQISRNSTPDLAEAAAISLEARGTSGDSRRSWTWPWRAALWARLGKPDKSAEMIRGLLTHNTLPNLFTTHPPFQIDGNFGITAGICEMLVQSHEGEISILPALSPTWQDGSFTGLKARGGFKIGAKWRNNRIATVAIHSPLGGEAILRLRHNPTTLTVSQDGKATATLKPASDGSFRIPTRQGSRFVLTTAF